MAPYSQQTGGRKRESSSAENGCSSEEGTACVGLTAYQRDVLAVLASEGPCKGAAVKRAIDVRHGKCSRGRVYNNLDALAKQGFVKKSALDKRTNTYELTRRGRFDLSQHRAWLGECLGAEGATSR